MRSNLRNERKSRRWTTAWVATQIAVSRRMYVFIEQGSRNPSLDVANRLEDLFEIPQRELLVLDSNTRGGKEAMTQ